MIQEEGGVGGSDWASKPWLISSFHKPDTSPFYLVGWASTSVGLVFKKNIWHIIPLNYLYFGLFFIFSV